MRFCVKTSSLTLALAVVSSAADEPKIKIVFPAEGMCVATEARTFVIGSVTPPDTPLTVNGQAVTPWRTGAFLFMAPVTPGSNTLVVRAVTAELRHTFTVPSAAPAWNGQGLRVLQPLHALGVQTGETVRLACRAPAGMAVFAAAGERTLALAPLTNQPTHYAADVTFTETAENVPVTFFADTLPDAPAAAITARCAWPTLSVTGGLFEVRARSVPGDGDTLAILPTGLCVQGAGFTGEHSRFWLADRLCYVETRHLTTAPAADNPPRDQPLPDLGAGFGPHPPTNRMPAELLIVLDPGHGGRSTGAVGPSGIPEKQVTLEQAKVVQTALEQAGFRVRLTRETDVELDLYDRVRLAYTERAAAFISIHYNSCVPATNPREARHLATYAWNAIGEQVARALHPHVAAVTAIPDGGVRTASFAVCRNPAVPSVLLELDFISTPEGEASIRRSDQQLRVAGAILAGLREWLNPPSQ